MAVKKHHTNDMILVNKQFLRIYWSVIILHLGTTLELMLRSRYENPSILPQMRSIKGRVVFWSEFQLLSPHPHAAERLCITRQRTNQHITIRQHTQTDKQTDRQTHTRTHTNTQTNKTQTHTTSSARLLQEAHRMEKFNGIATIQ